jgi:undecaprenyl pyrophosphate phosphatase UppP
MSSGPGPRQQQRSPALNALQAGKDAAGEDAATRRCLRCGGEHLRSVRQDAEENLFWAAVFLFAGVASLIVVVTWGDIGLYVANLSTLALAAVLVGVLLLLIARRRRRPSAQECIDCGQRMPSEMENRR